MIIQNLKLSSIIIKTNVALLILVIAIFAFTKLINSNELLYSTPLDIFFPVIIIIALNLIAYDLFSILFYFLNINYKFSLLLKNTAVSLLIVLSSYFIMYYIVGDISEEIRYAFIYVGALVISVLFIIIFTIYNMLKLRKEVKGLNKYA
ncbi:MAG: hypothetical protein A2909_00130 [Candidatus Tagabacteria bacterium RIFCSPLOWO2_01_FULL_39_11]|uniref:Uncharacterized protein n=1 Tax=Candidatus Tagabacteria bacterium RIFCSPLOWO2_01_FULL_39_11 TaxID=1802295 RepID=A0A1G2LU12_9BACT|nr:MAG: hypothetical protein A2909_00130 [Candidatus Tagabacteria bacterium RIFCSPLOWO2_01_FULL_39_11]